MATTTTDNLLAVHDDAALCVSDNPQHATGTPDTLRYAPLLDRGTQHHPLSAAIKQRRSPERPWGPSSMLQPRVAVGEQDCAGDGSQQVLHSEPCVVLCAEAFMVIKADLEAFGPGRAAALGVRGGLAEGERAF